MPIKVYTISGAPRPWRVLLGLTFKGLDFETVLLRASEKEHKSDQFLAVNPRGKVPVVTDGQVILRDSIASLAWLDQAYPDKPLFGRTSVQAATIWQRTEEIAEYLRAAVNGVLTPIFFQNATETTPELIEAVARLRSELAFVESELGDELFLGGQSASAADAVAFPEIRLLQRAKDTKPKIMSQLGLLTLYRDYPRVNAWVERVEAMPGYDRTEPPHWAEAA